MLKVLAKGVSWGHDDLANDLAKHLAQPNRMVWTNLPVGPVHTCRPDVLTIQKSFTKPTPLIYEIKVTRADLLRDIKTEKWKKYLAFSGGVYFAYPKGLALKEEIPAAAGIFIRSEKGWYANRAPKKIVNPELPQLMLLKLLIDGVGMVHSGEGDPPRSEHYFKKLELKMKILKEEKNRVLWDNRNLKFVNKHYSEEGKKLEASIRVKIRKQFEKKNPGLTIRNLKVEKK